MAPDDDRPGGPWADEPDGPAEPTGPAGPAGPLGPGQFYVPAPGSPAPSSSPPPSPSSAASERAGRAYRDSPGPAPRPTKPAPPNRPPKTRAPRAPKTGGSFWSRALRPKWRWLYLYLPLLIILLIVGALLYGLVQFNSLYRVDVGDALATPTGDSINYLLVGSDSREGIENDTPNSGAIGPEVKGRRADTIIVLQVSPDSSTMMSVPRDLWLTNAETGKEGRVNGSYNQGPDNLIRTVSQGLGIPIHHYVEIDFVSFAGMVDAMGGITIDFPHPAKDANSGLNIIAAGPQRLDGTQALAYVRSRHYTEIIDGKEVADPTADLGRQVRQQTFIRTVLDEAGSTRNPITLAKLSGAAAKGVRVDTEFGIGDAWTLVRRLGSSTPETVVLPTTPARKGGAAVLVLDEPEAQAVLAQFK